MPDDTGDLGVAKSTDLTVQTLDEIQATGPELPPPSEITDTYGPVRVARERRDWERGAAHEASDGVRVQAEEEGDEEVVRVPERLERLLSDAVVRGRVHEHHAQEHHMSRNAAGFRVVDLQGSYLFYELAMCYLTQR